MISKGFIFNNTGSNYYILLSGSFKYYRLPIENFIIIVHAPP